MHEGAPPCVQPASLLSTLATTSASCSRRAGLALDTVLDFSALCDVADDAHPALSLGASLEGTSGRLESPAVALESASEELGGRSQQSGQWAASELGQHFANSIVGQQGQLGRALGVGTATRPSASSRSTCSRTVLMTAGREGQGRGLRLRIRLAPCG